MLSPIQPWHYLKYSKRGKWPCLWIDLLFLWASSGGRDEGSQNPQGTLWMWSGKFARWDASASLCHSQWRIVPGWSFPRRFERRLLSLGHHYLQHPGRDKLLENTLSAMMYRYVSWRDTNTSLKLVHWINNLWIPGLPKAVARCPLPWFRLRRCLAQPSAYEDLCW